jgi:hypothetical protein
MNALAAIVWRQFIHITRITMLATTDLSKIQRRLDAAKERE